MSVMYNATVEMKKGGLKANDPWVEVNSFFRAIILYGELL
jgi:hypothetical protein